MGVIGISKTQGMEKRREIGALCATCAMITLQVALSVVNDRNWGGNIRGDYL